MTTFLRDAEDFLARLPSITLDGMDPLIQKQADPLSAKLAASPAVQTTEQVVPNMEDCLRLVNKQSGVGGDKCVPNNMGMGRPAKPAYSPTSMLYPLTSIESFSDAGQSMDSIDANAISANCLMTRDSGMTAGGYTESDVAEEELGLRRSPRSSGSRSKGSKQPKEKRKVGRPIAYTGDPEAADLTPAERRRIKRRIANRESARRVRARRQDQIEDMAQKAQEMERHNMALASHASTVEAQQGAIHAQLAEYTQRLRATEAQNDALQREIAHMRAFIASKGLKSEAGGSGRQELEGRAAALAPVVNHAALAPVVNHTSDQAGVSGNPSACSMPATLDACAMSSSFSNGMHSAFTASAAGPPTAGEEAPPQGGAAAPASLQMLDMPMGSTAAWPASRGVSGLLLGLGNAASIDQLLPNMDPLGGMTLNEFLLGEAC